MRWGERDLYNQLVYFASLFDVDRARSGAAAGDGGRFAFLPSTTASASPPSRASWTSISTSVAASGWLWTRCSQSWGSLPCNVVEDMMTVYISVYDDCDLPIGSLFSLGAFWACMGKGLGF